MENDTCDTQRQPLHAEVTWVNEVPVSSQNEIFGENSAFVGENSDPKKACKKASSPSRPRLTLSAFRRPENTVRIADLDASRKITTEYDFASSRILGHGASSTVRLAVRRKDGVNVAVKTIAKHEALRIRRMRHGARRHLDEWEVLQSLRDNAHVVTLLDVFETDEEIQLVMEYCGGGELFDVIQRKRNQALASPDKAYRYSESKAARIVSQMLSVLVELHSRGVVHRDVKPDNILLTCDSEMCAKLSDFGTSRELHPEEESDSCSSDGEASPLTPQSRKRAYSAVGSNFYAAPEVRSGEGYGTAVDVYSLGVTLYVLLCGFPPSFTTDEEDDVVAFPSFSHLSEDVKRLIRKMVDPDASRRITAKNALQDKWIVRHTRSPTLHMPARRTILSPSAPRPVVDMELVCSRLFNGLDSSSSDENEARVPKRRKVKDDFCLSMVDLYKGVASAEAGVYCDGLSMADLYKGVSSAAASAEAGVYCDGLSMADLYKGVASAAASAEAAAAGVYSVGDCICVMEDEEEDRVTSPFEASFTALSV
jgi:calcium-dependent protein kinase